MIKTRLLIVLLLFAVCCVFSQQEEQSIVEFRKELTQDFKNPKKSPLKNKARKFKGHIFYPIDSSYIVNAVFTRTLNALPFPMKTTTDRLPVYEKYGEATFEINGKSIKLSVYQSHALRTTEAYENHLFLPFTDKTNGGETYSGGRFLDLTIPEGNTIRIDFNKAYNPYCAYSKAYSCPIPPEENSLDVAIRAGIKKPK